MPLSYVRHRAVEYHYTAIQLKGWYSKIFRISFGESLFSLPYANNHANPDPGLSTMLIRSGYDKRRRDIQYSTQTKSQLTVKDQWRTACS